MGIKNITICASSLGKAHAGLVPYMEDGTITGTSLLVCAVRLEKRFLREN